MLGVRGEDPEPDCPGCVALEVKQPLPETQSRQLARYTRIRRISNIQDIEAPGRLHLERLVARARAPEAGGVRRRDVRRCLPGVQGLGYDVLTKGGDGDASVGLVLDTPRRRVVKARVGRRVDVPSVLDVEVAHGSKGSLIAHLRCDGKLRVRLVSPADRDLARAVVREVDEGIRLSPVSDSTVHEYSVSTTRTIDRQQEWELLGHEQRTDEEY